MANIFERSFKSIPNANQLYDCYTAPNSIGNKATVIGLTICNVNASGNAITVKAQACDYQDSDAAYHLAFNTPIAAGGTLVLVGGDQKLVLEYQDKIKVSCNTASSAEVIISVLEIT